MSGGGGSSVKEFFCGPSYCYFDLTGVAVLLSLSFGILVGFYAFFFLSTIDPFLFASFSDVSFGTVNSVLIAWCPLLGRK